MPFLKSAAVGLYSPDERTISMGANDWQSQRIPVLAHEVAHCLDIEAGTALGLTTRCLKGRRMISSNSLAEADAYQGKDRLIREATRRMNRAYQAYSLFRRKDGLPEAEKGERAALSFVLSHYWRTPREVFARLFEQYVSTKLGSRRDSDRISVQADYTTTPAYWTAADWAALEPMVETEIKRRLEILQQKV